jgi:hypothetical protein
MSERYPIIWVHTRIKGRNQKRGRRCFAGFCGKTNMLYHISDRLMVPLIVRDFGVSDDGRCEEEEGCLNQSCPLNRTTMASYWKYHGFTKRPPKTGALKTLELPEDLRGSTGGGIVMGKGDCGPVFEIVTESDCKEPEAAR